MQFLISYYAQSTPKNLRLTVSDYLIIKMLSQVNELFIYKFLAWKYYSNIMLQILEEIRKYILISCFYSLVSQSTILNIGYMCSFNWPLRHLPLCRMNINYNYKQVCSKQSSIQFLFSFQLKGLLVSLLE